ncbi:MAG TPA: phosphoglucomutase/phosphomannomutase family protein [Bacillota bacterium]|nr:phosphoglucomutase/phosphomannomutase family protein [Bacillota bacterium]
MIKFGTDGWRAVISEEFTFANVQVVAQAIADYITMTEQGCPVVVIGYDTRFLSDAYGAECARVLAANGIKVLLSDRVIPTPALSFAVKNRQAAGGIMVTASHNPYQYNGIKYKAAYGGSALPDIIKGIEAKLHENTPKVMTLAEGLAKGLIEYFNGEEEYSIQINSLVDLDKIAAAGARVVIDPMYGAGAGFIRRLLAEKGLAVSEIRGEHNPLFGGVNPEPIGPNLKGLVAEVGACKAVAGFATDGDADRVGAVDASGQFVNSHIIYALLLRYLVTQRHWSGGVVKTFSTSLMIDKLAARYGLKVFETPIGFKYICELFLKEDILLGGEESGGIGFKNHVPERDGILCSLMLMEIMAVSGKSLAELVEDLMQEIGWHYYDRVDLHLSPEVKAKGMEQLGASLPSAFAGLKVSEVQTLDGIKFVLEESSWILFRASGTEPVVRIYAESGDLQVVQRLLQEGQKLFRRGTNAG